MSQAATRVRNALRGKSDRSSFDLSDLFPEHAGHKGPFPKQLQIFEWTIDGHLTGGGAVYEGGKGSGKTITGSAWIIWAHHRQEWRGLRSLIGRETYSALLTSTADEFFTMVEKLPPAAITGYSRPSKNAMGWVEWLAGGVTLLCSLSDSSNWESANLGAVWVDEGHRQQQRIMLDLMTRIRQVDAPRAMLVTKNPSGKDWIWKMSASESKAKDPSWYRVQAATDENPALPPDYIARLERVYGKDTPAYRRWVKGQASALEDVAFPTFDPEASNCVHVIPAFEIPEDWHRSRGLDYGHSRPTAVVYGAQAPWGDWYIWRTHSKAGWTIPMHAEVIRELDEEFGCETGPADPTVCYKTADKITGLPYSIADTFWEHGVAMYPGQNDRKSGLAMVRNLISIDPDKTHLVTGELGAPSLYIFEGERNEPLIHCLSNLLEDRPDGSPNRDGPDDVQKKDDHEYDALRYLVMDRPTIRFEEPVGPRLGRASHSRGSYVGY